MEKRRLFAVVYNVTTELQDKVNAVKRANRYTSVLYGIYNSPEEAQEDIADHIQYMKSGSWPYSWLTVMQMNEIDPSFIIKEYYRDEDELNELPSLEELRIVTLAKNQKYDPFTGVITLGC